MTHGGRSRRRIWGRLALGLALWCGVAGWVAAEPPAAARVPARPPDGVYDDARMFSDEQRRAAVEAIAEARKDGVAVYLAAFTFIVDETIERRAERLKQAWCGDEIGLIVVVDASTSQCTYLTHLSGRDWLPGAELRQIFEEATAASVTLPTVGERLLGVVENLVPRIHSALATRRASAPVSASLREWFVLGGVVGACGILLAVVWAGRRLRGRVQAARPAPAFFPTVAIEPRFGGPFAGGVAAELDFGADGNKGRANAPTAV